MRPNGGRPPFDPGPISEGERRQRAARLKERIYLTFAALAVVVTLASGGHSTAGQAAVSLLVTVLGTLLAVFSADVIAHIVVHGNLSAAELREAIRSSFGALGAVVLPFVFLGLAGLGVWTVETALNASAIALLAALVIIGWIAVRRIPLTWYQRLIALGVEALLGVAVIVLKLIAH